MHIVFFSNMSFFAFQWKICGFMCKNRTQDFGVLISQQFILHGTFGKKFRSGVFHVPVCYFLIKITSLYINREKLLGKSIYLSIYLSIYILTNLLITSLLVLCFSQWFLLFLLSASKISFDFLSSYRLLFWYLLFRYRWAHHLCFLSMNDLSRSSFFDV